MDLVYEKILQLLRLSYRKLYCKLTIIKCENYDERVIDMKPLQENLWNHRTKLFVGRHREMQQLEEWLENPAAPLQIFSMTGMAGIGKSSLLTNMLRFAREKDVLEVWLDGRSCIPTPAGFLEYLTTTIMLEKWYSPLEEPLEFLFGANPQRRVILCIDNFEQLSILEGWLLEAFLPKLSRQGILILLGSRSKLSTNWTLHPTLGGYICKLALEPLSYEEIFEYISFEGLFQQETIGEMAKASDGHPFALALAVEAAVKNKMFTGQEKMIISQTISGRVLRELTSPELEPLVEVLMVVQYANQEMLSLICEHPVGLAQYQLLQTLSFIQLRPEGLHLHDLARMHLLRDFKLRQPERLHSLRTKAATVLYQQLKTTKDRYKRRHIASQMLMLSKDALPMDHRLYADFTVDSRISPLESVRKDDLPMLHEILNIWCQYSIDPWQKPVYHRFLDELVIKFPESIAVLRDDVGNPMGMFIELLVYAETSKFLKKYFSAELAECFNEEELFCTPDEADTYFPILVAATDKMPGFTKEELVGLLLLDRLSLLGEGARVVLIATDENLKVILQQLGFRLRPTITRHCDTSYAKAHVLELDFRNGQFGEWILSFFQEQKAENYSMKMPNLTATDIRKLLSAIHSPVDLQLFIPYFKNSKSGFDVQRMIMNVLKDETTILSQNDRQLLHTTYYTYAGNRILAAEECGMSRATFYRHLSRAISNLLEILKQQYLK